MEQYERHPLTPSMDAVWTTHCAVRILLESGGFADAVITAVNLGGDTDTVGAVTGGLAGAAWGLGSIPEEWLATLQDSGTLCGIGQELVSVSCE
jgi:ADP-ribosyl-[dinitrogen reductase] hydrolase